MADDRSNTLGTLNALLFEELERRIERIDGMLDGMGKGAESRFEAIERRIAAMERKLNHKTREAE